MPDWYAGVRGPLLLLQSVAGMLVFAFPLSRRKHFIPRLVVSVLAGAVVCQFVTFGFYSIERTFWGGLSRFASGLMIYLALIAAALCSYQESFFTALFVASSGYAAQDIGGTCKQLAKLLPLGERLSQHPVGVLGLDLLCYGGCFVLLGRIFWHYIRERDENFDNRIKALFSFCVMLLCIGMARITRDISVRVPITEMAECIYQLICNTLVLVLQFGVMEHAKIARQADSMRELVHQQSAQYTASKESIRLVNEKYHDLKALLQGGGGNVSKSQLEKLEHSIDAYDVQVHTGNPLLDVLLTEKRTLCIHRQIRFTCYVDGAAFGFMEELDLYALFNNGLNNAVEAVCQLPEGAERFINLTAKREGEMVLIHMENPCAGQIRFQDGLPQSRRDPRYHGFGVKSMERTAEKYGGSLSARQDGDRFCLDILMFAPSGNL